MPLANRPWNTSYPGVQDTVGVEQPDLIGDSYDGARDGHRILIDHVHSLRDKLQQVALLVGDSSDLPAATSLRDRVTTLEGAGGGDADAIHDNVAAEISAVAAKGVPVAADYLLIEDSAAADAKKSITIDDLPAKAGSDSTAIHDDTASEISAITLKGVPVVGDIILIEDSAAANVKKRITIGTLPTGSDANAIHDNVASEISAITTKGVPVAADFLLIEDSADSNNKKKVTIGTLPTGLDADAIHDNVAGEINAISVKGTPVNGDLVVIEDSADSFNKKKATLSSLPGGGGGSSTYVGLTDTPANFTGARGQRPSVNFDEDAIEFSGFPDFIDDLDDDSFDSDWTSDIPSVGTVTEQNSRLEIGYTGADTVLDWITGNFNAPGAYLDLHPADFTIKVFVSNTGSTNLVAGMFKFIR